MTTRHLSVLALAAALSPAPLLAADIVIDRTAEACALDLSDSRITLTETAVQFWESTCEITSDTPVGDGARDVTMACSGEGETWENTLRIEETATGYRLTGEGGPVDFVRCN